MRLSSILVCIVFLMLSGCSRGDKNFMQKKAGPTAEYRSGESVETTAVEETSAAKEVNKVEEGAEVVDAGKAGEDGAPEELQLRGKEIVVFKASKGDVSFPHREHQAKFECVTCHHKTPLNGTPEACSHCHGKVDEAPSMKEALHKRCKDCHREQSGPIQCTECHSAT